MFDRHAGSGKEPIRHMILSDVDEIADLPKNIGTR